MTSTAPAGGATAVSTATTVTATFNEAMNASTLTAGTFVLRNPSGVVVPATVAYNASTKTATLTPSQALARSTTYIATVSGGTGGVTDLAGNPLAGDTPGRSPPVPG